MLGLMNRYLLRLKPKSAEKSNWPKEHQFKTDLIENESILGINLKQTAKDLQEQMSSIVKIKLRTCIIHSDFRSMNRLSKTIN